MRFKSLRGNRCQDESKIRDYDIARFTRENFHPTLRANGRSSHGFFSLFLIKQEYN